MALLRNSLPPQLTADEWVSAVKTVTICVAALVFTLALCLACFFRNYVDPTVLTAVVGLASGVFGYLFGKRTPPEQPKIQSQPTGEPNNEKAKE